MEGFSFRDTESFLPLRLGATARDTLQEFVDIDVTAEDLVGILRRNQVYRDLFARFVNQKTQPRNGTPGAKAKNKDPKGAPEAKPAEAPVSLTHRLINLLGMIGSRNLILALRMHRALTGTFPITEDDEVDLKASDYVKRALETEEIFLRNKMEYSETAFAAAVYYDWVLRWIGSESKDKQKLADEYGAGVWKKAQRTGILAYHLSRLVSGLAPKQALAAGMLTQGGKLLLARRLPSYAAFEGPLDKDTRIPPLAALLLERKKFGVTHEEVSAHSLFYFDVFEDLWPCVRSYREPYLVKGNPNQHRLACLLYLADSMARAWKLPANETDPLLKSWLHPSLKVLKLKPAQLISTMKTVMTLR